MRYFVDKLHCLFNIRSYFYIQWGKRNLRIQSIYFNVVQYNAMSCEQRIYVNIIM